jgi:hypothetical protein
MNSSGRAFENDENEAVLLCAFQPAQLPQIGKPDLMTMADAETAT